MDTQTPEKNPPVSVQIPSLRAYLCFPGGQASPKSPAVPPAAVLGIRDGDGSALGSDLRWRTLGRQHSRKSLSHSEPWVMEG